MSSLNHEPEGYTHMNLWVRLFRGDPRPLSLYWFFILLIQHPIPDENSFIPILHPWKKWHENLAMPFTETVAQLKVPHPPGRFGPQGPEMLLYFNSISVDVKWNSWWAELTTGSGRCFIRRPATYRQQAVAFMHFKCPQASSSAAMWHLMASPTQCFYFKKYSNNNIKSPVWLRSFFFLQRKSNNQDIALHLNTSKYLQRKTCRKSLKLMRLSARRPWLVLVLAYYS